MERQGYPIWDQRHKLANFAETPVGINRRQNGTFVRTFLTSEQLYQMSKFLPKYKEIREAIMFCNDPAEAKRITKANKDKIREDWNDEFRYKVMAGIIRLKVRQNRDVSDELLNTIGMDIYEDANMYAPEKPTKIQVEEMRIWGIYKGEGENWIGVILMNLRSELLEQGKV